MENRPTDNNITGNLTGYLEDLASRLQRTEGDESREIVDRAVAEIRDCINSERLIAASRIAGWLAHKINNPLGTISGNAQLLGRRLNRDISDEDALSAYRRYIEAMQNQIERCVEITSELLEFTRLRDVEVQSINLIQIMETAAEMACYNRGQSRVSVETAGILPEVKTDGELLVKVLYEVIINAIYAAGETGDVKVTAGNDGLRSVWIKVADTGPGIPESVLPMVFDPFFSTREKAKGLGLTSSLAIVKQLNGTLEITDTGSNGTVITVKIPSGDAR